MKKITERVKTMSDVYAIKGVSEADVLPFPEPALVVEDDEISEFRKGVNAAAKLFLLAEVLNEGWKPDWSNWDQRKYYPWFYLGAAGGSGFSFGDFVYVGSSSRVGSRLVFKSRELAEYAGKQFLDIYQDFMTFSTK